MRWRKYFEYKTSFMIDEKEYEVVARKSGDDDFFAVEIDGEYITDCEELPTHEYLKRLMDEENELTRTIDAATFKV